MFSARFVRGFSSCYKITPIAQRISYLFYCSNMESSKRPLDESNSESNTLVKKIKTEVKEEVSEHKYIHKALENTNKFRKPKKIVLLLSYLGKDFFGLQRNQDVNTVEEELLKAMLKANIILQDEFDHPKTMKFQRAARTDKGVSAVRNIVSLKIPMKEICETLPEKINNYLQPEVRVIAYKRVTQSFDAKIACDARTYSYTLPTFAFAPDVEGSSEEYRITDERIQEVNAFLKNYLGTHNYYNFTSGRLPGDPSCKRYIMSCECTPPFESNHLEFTVIKVKGQSFMLHQIRKMVGLAIAYMRNLTGEDILKKSWENERIDIPKAPGLGLMLEELHYDWYDSKYGSDGIHEPLKWEQYNDIIETFKRENICANIAKTEREEKSMLQWLQTLPYHSYDVRDAGPPTMLPSKLEQTSESVDSEKPNADVSDNKSTIEENVNNHVKIECSDESTHSKKPDVDTSNDKSTVEENVNIHIKIECSDSSNNVNDTEIKCAS